MDILTSASPSQTPRSAVPPTPAPLASAALATAPLGSAAPARVSPADVAAPLVHARGLRLTVGAASGPVNILAGIDLDIAPGESVGLVGPSGSGKTSLLMVLAGLERATGGVVRVDGQDLTTSSEDALARLRRQSVGIVFQSFHLIPTMTALENVALPLELAGAPRAAARARESLQAVGLGHRLTHLPGQLSGGEQQRVALARAFAPEPRLLLADEPTGNLDVATGRVVMDLLFAMQARLGTTLLLITHDPALAARCGRRLHMRDGRITDPDAAPEASRQAQPPAAPGTLSGAGQEGAGQEGAGQEGAGQEQAGQEQARQEEGGLAPHPRTGADPVRAPAAPAASGQVAV